jgi:hypothetical protein
VHKVNSCLEHKPLSKKNVTPLLKPDLMPSTEVKGDFDKTCRSKAIVSAQETMMALTNIDGSLKRDSNDCLVKDIEKKRNGMVGCEKHFLRVRR